MTTTATQWMRKFDAFHIKLIVLIERKGDSHTGTDMNYSTIQETNKVL